MRSSRRLQGFWKDNFWVFVDFVVVKLPRNILSSLETAHVYHKSSHITHTSAKRSGGQIFAYIDGTLAFVWILFALFAGFRPLFLIFFFSSPSMVVVAKPFDFGSKRIGFLHINSFKLLAEF